VDVKRRISRRALFLLLALGGMVLGGVGTWMITLELLRDGPPENAESVSGRQRLASWVRPTIWDRMASGVRARYLMVDEWVFERENAVPSQQEIVARVVEYVMSLNGADDLKTLLATYMRDQWKSAYLYELVSHGLDVNLAVPRVRRVILAVVEGFWDNFGVQAVSSKVADRVRQLRSDPLETDPGVIRILDRMLPAFSAAGI
jgi:hypothetical protein